MKTMKRLLMALVLLLCAALLCACTGDDGTRFNVFTGDGQQSQSANNGSGQSYEGYDPTQEEDYAQEYPELDVPEVPVVTNTPVPTIRGEYAGATPVVIDPIDKPTPTPVPKLAVNYTVYDATKLGLSFEGPVGWIKDDTGSDVFMIQNPDGNIDYAATLTLTKQKVNSDYSTNNLKTVVQSLLDQIGTASFEDYNPSRTDTRELLGKTGVYANYDGVLIDGTEIAGRVHAVCVDKVLYTLHLTAPAGQWNDYKEMVYDHLRDTIKITK